MIEIIPAIDIIDGECVRLTQGDYAQKTSYFKDPAEVAKRYEAIGIRRLHVVDLDGAKSSEPMNLAVLEAITKATNLDVQWGGGVKSDWAMEVVLGAGANRVICGSVAVKEPRMFQGWIDKYGSEHVILGADVRNGRVATHGWLSESDVTAEELIASYRGVTQVVCTDITKDGMLQGPTFELYVELQNRFPEIDITVSGGISSMDDIIELDRLKLRSVIVGKAIYEGTIELETIEQWLKKE